MISSSIRARVAGLFNRISLIEPVAAGFSGWRRDETLRCMASGATDRIGNRNSSRSDGRHPLRHDLLTFWLRGIASHVPLILCNCVTPVEWLIRTIRRRAPWAREDRPRFKFSLLLRRLPSINFANLAKFGRSYLVPITWAADYVAKFCLDLRKAWELCYILLSTCVSR